MARFPFEEDPRFRFGAFDQLVRRYIFIGREPPPERRPVTRPAAPRRETPRGEHGRPTAPRRRPVASEFALHALAGGAP